MRKLKNDIKGLGFEIAAASAFIALFYLVALSQEVG